MRTIKYSEQHSPPCKSFNDHWTGNPPRRFHSGRESCWMAIPEGPTQPNVCSLYHSKPGYRQIIHKIPEHEVNSENAFRRKFYKLPGCPTNEHYMPSLCDMDHPPVYRSWSSILPFNNSAILMYWWSQIFWQSCIGTWEEMTSPPNLSVSSSRSWWFLENSDLGIGVCCEGCACGNLKGKILDSVINCSKSA